MSSKRLQKARFQINNKHCRYLANYMKYLDNHCITGCINIRPTIKLASEEVGYDIKKSTNSNYQMVSEKPKATLPQNNENIFPLWDSEAKSL